jgi:AraC-like DNA-binding protein
VQHKEETAEAEVRESALQNASAQGLAQQVVAYVESHCTEKLSCALVAREFSYHSNSFNRIIQEELGCSLHEVITRVKIDAAIRLLTETDMSIADIAYRTSFYDHAHFAKVFRKATGFSPSDYRQTHRSAVEQEAT